MPAPLARPIALLVEDSEDDTFFFRRALKRADLPCSLYHVNDGGAAIDYLKKAHAAPADPAHPWPDLVFLDLKLPTFSGFEILAWIRQQKFVRPLDVEVLSGSDQKSDVERALALGATLYSVKPVSCERLQARLRGWLDQHATADAAAPALPARG